MKRALLLLLFLGGMALLSARPGTAQPPAAIGVLRSSAQATYPGSIDFSLEVNGGEEISKVTLNYWTEAK